MPYKYSVKEDTIETGSIRVIGQYDHMTDASHRARTENKKCKLGTAKHWVVENDTGVIRFERGFISVVR